MTSMTLSDAISLLGHPPIATKPVHWADLGCGAGLFTLALAHFLPQDSTIEAIDLNPTIARQTTKKGVTIIPHTADFTREALPPNLDGILMANSLHYVNDQPTFLARIGRVPNLLIIEYDTDRPVGRWVPYPLSFATLSTLLSSAGWPHIQKLGSRPSAFGRANLYSALATA